MLSRLTPAIHNLTGIDLSSARAWWDGGGGQEPGEAGPRANLRLTAVTGAVVLPLAVIVLLTGLYFDSFWRIHFFIAFLLLPVVLLKIGSTTYRMARYYLHSGLYLFVRPPYPLGRVTSPILVLSAVVLFFSGIAMWLTHSQADPWGWLHTDAAIAFSCIAAVHLAMYLPEALRSAQEDVRPARSVGHSARSGRLAAVGAAVLVGLVLALATFGFSQRPAHPHRDRRASTGESPVPPASLTITGNP